MLIVGENIHIISSRAKKAINHRDAATIQQMAQAQAEGGAGMLDLNIGPQRKRGPEIMEWLVNVVQDVVDLGLSFDTTNLAAIETGLKLAKTQAMINSTSAEPERLERVPPLAAQYNAKLIALMMGKSGIPVAAEERVAVAIESLVPRAMELGIPMQNLYLDPLVLTVAGTQEYCPHAIEAVRYVKQGMDPAPRTIAGLSNVSNNVPEKNRSLIDQVYLVMLMAAGIDAVIADPTDAELTETIRIIEERDASTGTGQLLLTLYDATEAMEELDASQVDMADPYQADIWKTVQVLMNKIIFTESYLRA